MKRSTADGPPPESPSTEPRRLAERAARLLAEARAYRPQVSVTFEDIQAELEARPRFGRGSWGRPARLLLAGAIVFALVAGLGSLALSRGWLWRPEPAAPTFLSVPAGSTTRVERRGRFRMAIHGPAAVEVREDDEHPLRLDEGAVVVSAEGHPVTIEAAGHRVAVPAAASVEIATSAAAGALRVQPVEGARPSLDGAPVRVEATREAGAAEAAARETGAAAAEPA